MNIGGRLGCHQMPERSFFYKGYQFPVCARCTGVLIATVFAIPMFFINRISIPIAIVLSGVMLLDWSLQWFHIKESTNTRRLISGIIGGYGYMTLWLYLYLYIFKFARWLFIQ